jgi:hypothetical protein
MLKKYYFYITFVLLSIVSIVTIVVLTKTPNSGLPGLQNTLFNSNSLIKTSEINSGASSDSISQNSTSNTPTPQQDQSLNVITIPYIPSVSSGSISLPPTGPIKWDWQIGANDDEAITTTPGLQLIDVDGFTTSAQKVSQLKNNGIYTVCYINAGSWEPSRPDSAIYPDSLKLQQDPDWPQEYFLDITDVFKPNSILASILTKRFEMCKSKGFDALEPDNLQNDENVSGDKITLQQQLDFNGWVADTAHSIGLAVFQKNGPDKILLTDKTGQKLVDKFDGILNEECQQFDECSSLSEYTKRGKLALNVEYKTTLDCSLYTPLSINALQKDLLLVGGNMSGYKRNSCH